MRLNFQWLDEAEINSLSRLNERFFYTRDAEDNGFKAASEVLAAMQGFMNDSETVYKERFHRIRPAQAHRSSGVILHKLLELTEPKMTCEDRADHVIQLLEFMAYRGNVNTRDYAFLMIAEYLDYLDFRGGPMVDYAASKLVELAETRDILKRLWAPSVPLSNFGDFCLYRKVSEAIAKQPNPEQWFKTNISQATMLKAYETGNHPELLQIMTRKTRGRALETDLGM